MPPPAPGATGIEYLRGYHTLVGMRVITQAVAARSDGARVLQPIRIVQSSASLAAGGSREDQ